MTRGAGRLAVEGGSPVRRGPLPYDKGVDLIGETEREAVLEVLDSRSLFRYYGPAFGGRVERFERACEAAFATPHAVAVTSGTAALRTALAALGVGAGDEVVVPAYTFIATVNAVVAAGAAPVFAEIDDSLGLDSDAVAAAVSGRTAAVVPVHLENVAADLDALAAVSSAGGLVLLEDAAQAMGVTYHGRPVGTIGAMGAFSMQLSKNITTGEGGVVVTSDDRLHLRAARYQDQGGQFVTQHGRRGDDLGEPFVGDNLRMTEIAGALAEVQLTRLPGILAAMRANHDRIAAAVGDVCGLTPRRYPDPDGYGGSSLTWFAPDGDLARMIIEALWAEGVPAVQMYEAEPVYANPAVLARRTATLKGPPWHSAEYPAPAEYRVGMCPVSESLVARSVTIGVGPAFSEADCDDCAAAVVKVAEHLLG